jgi:hypothetical protein
MGNERQICIADFSRYPSGRDANDGSFNGEAFRSRILLPAVKSAIAQNSNIRISLAGVMSFGSSFLEEAFGGLVRKEGIPKDKLRKVMTIDPGDPKFSRYSKAILRYINEA